jgi:DNA (cytosine-5)-methyltransferase 1
VIQTAVPTVAVDFFCGAGGMTNGLIKAGIHVLAGIDIEPLCRSTYLQNKNADGARPLFLNKDIFPRTRAHPAGQQHEIRDALTEALRDFRRKHGVRKQRLVFAICAPCQPFTKITKIAMSESRQFKRDTDSNLLLTTMGLIREFKPDAIVFENVEGLVNERRDSVIETFRRMLVRNGYRFDAKVINARHFGIPQNRRRTIGLAVRSMICREELTVPAGDSTLRKFPTVSTTIGHLPALAAGEIHDTIPNHRARALSEINLKRISSVKPGESNQVLCDTRYGDLSLKCHQRLEKQTGERSFSDTYTRMRGESFAPTITTRCVSLSNGRFGHFDVSQNRAITPKEAALLQTFPQGYVFHPETNIDFTAALIGNAVPPRLARFFGRYIDAILRQAERP